MFLEKPSQSCASGSHDPPHEPAAGSGGPRLPSAMCFTKPTAEHLADFETGAGTAAGEFHAGGLRWLRHPLPTGSAVALYPGGPVKYSVAADSGKLAEAAQFSAGGDPAARDGTFLLRTDATADFEEGDQRIQKLRAKWAQNGMVLWPQILSNIPR